MTNPVPRIAAIHGLAGFGRASLSVVIPVLSTMGCQVCPFPTAVLSTHGGFPGYVKVDITDSMQEYMEHWEQLEVRFDAIYSGFLGSPIQIEMVGRFIDAFAEEDQLVVIDPVMGDNGKIYGIIDVEMLEGMKGFVNKANIITPNFTEAAFLLGKEYPESVSVEEIKEWIHRLGEMGPRRVIITSVPFGERDNSSSVVAFDRYDGRIWRINCSYVPAYYPGTGDIFTSVIVGSILQGDSLPIALDRAVQFVSIAIRASFGHTTPKQEGVLLERVLDNLRAPVTSSTYEIMD
jgi:pyridoxine kinase